MARKSKKKLPKIHVRFWVRGKGHPSTRINWAFKKAASWAMIGEIKTGKSCAGETIASNYLEQEGCTLIDLFGSRDNEGLAWLRSPYKDSVCLLKGRSVEVDCEYPVMNALDFRLSDIPKYKVFVSPACLYSTLNEEWYSIGKLVDKLWRRHHWDWPTPVLLREASNLIYARMSLGDVQQLAKNYLAYFGREMRHCGFATILDTIRWRGIDINFRSVDYLFIKGQGIEGLSSQGLGFIYSWFDPQGLQKMGPAGAVVVCRRGPVGLVEFDYPYWHKKEHEDLLKMFGIEPHYRELPHYGEKGFQRVSDFEHVAIIKLRVEKKLSMEKIANLRGRSPRTIQQHLRSHNDMVFAVGECDKCARVNSPYAKQEC